ncbi:MAG: type II secretion system GspH family protein [Opitutales bacterium]|nr:type II secretion system GspH family protein [Opitutales bacterium]
MKSLFFIGNRSCKKAFTLAEVLMTLGVFSILSSGLISFFIFNLGTSYMTTGKLLVGKDIRQFTNELRSNGRASSSFLIYPSFVDREYSSEQENVPRGGSGDFLVLVRQVPDRLPQILPDGSLDPDGPGEKFQRVTHLVGYYRNGTPSDDGAEVRRFMVDLSDISDPDNPYHRDNLVDRMEDASILPRDKAPPIRDIPATADHDGEEGLLTTYLPDPSTVGSEEHRLTLELSRGLAEGVLFYNFQDQSVIVRGEIIHRGNRQQRASNTYNFTVTPRG